MFSSWIVCVSTTKTFGWIFFVLWAKEVKLFLPRLSKLISKSLVAKWLCIITTGNRRIHPFTHIPKRYWSSLRSIWLDIGEVLCVFIDRNEVEVNKNATKKRYLYTAILTEEAWSIRDLLYLFSGGTNAGNLERKRWAHFDRSGSQSEHRIHFISPTRGFSHIIKPDLADPEFTKG